MRKEFTEGFKGEGSPDLKYYAFDWDDNIVHMPTKIIVKDEDGDEVGMSTDDFAEHRHHIGKEPFEYKGKMIVGFGENPFKNFRTEGDKDFFVDPTTGEKIKIDDKPNSGGLSTTTIVIISLVGVISVVAVIIGLMNRTNKTE